jgi:hypothetical protein
MIYWCDCGYRVNRFDEPENHLRNFYCANCRAWSVMRSDQLKKKQEVGRGGLKPEPRTAGGVA